MASPTRLSALLALLGIAGLASAQNKAPSAPSEAAQAAEKSANAWLVSASGLEQHLAGLLPCDPAIRSSIDDVSRASDARFNILIASWQDAAKMAREQTDATTKMLAESETRASAWKADQALAEQEQTRLGVQASDLLESARQRPGLLNAARVLNGISQSATAAAKVAGERSTSAGELDVYLNELLTKAQFRQTTIDNAVKALVSEKTRWSDYYTARSARAQMECSITRPAPKAPAPATRPADPARGGK